MTEQNDFEKDELKAIVHSQHEQICALQIENDELSKKLQLLLQERYGKKSEKIPNEILPVVDEAVVTPEEAQVIVDIEQEISVSGYTKEKPKRKPIPPEFERETIIHDLPLEQQTCGCGCQMHCIG